MSVTDGRTQVNRAAWAPCLTPLTVRTVLLSVDVYGDDAANLIGHVVDGAGHGARADAASVATCKSNQNGVRVWDPGDACQHGISDPGVGRRRQGNKSDEEGQHPHVTS